MKIKICGLTNAKDVKLCVEKGTDYIGFIFYKKSPRYINGVEAGKILKGISTLSVPVGVFVNENIEEVIKTADLTGIRVLQLHGDEDQKYIDYLRSRNFTVIKSISVKDESSLSRCDVISTDYFLLDTWHEKIKGGVGSAFNWEILRGREELLMKSFIAGGINASNMEKFIEKYSCYALDVNSGVERSPGFKDAVKLDEIFAIFREKEKMC